MNAQAMWTFEPRSKRSVKRDPFEAEFFTGEEETESVYGRTDALVRETIQNSLDAKASDVEQVRVRFFLPADDQYVTDSEARRLLNGLLPHLDGLQNEFVSSTRVPPMNYLVIEDFGTRGLDGDPERTEDPSAEHQNCEDFYWFWRNVGRSGKSGTDRGRWGVGKTVFPATSKINAVFGLTVRSSDQRRLLMGQAITKIHRVGETEYEPEGFFCDVSASEEIQMPVEDASVLNEFGALFQLERESEPGLSLVIPYRFDRLDDAEIVRSVIVHFFDPILRGQLAVDVCGPHLNVRIEDTTIDDIAAKLTWQGKRKEKKHVPPPFALARWAIGQQRAGTLTKLTNPSGARVPVWSDAMFSGDTLSRLRTAFASGEKIGVRVPLTIEKKDRSVESTYFDVFLEREIDKPAADDHFVREGMTISGISTVTAQRGLRGLVIVQDKALSALLGDAEGPAHMEWGTGEVRPEATYQSWKRRVTFVRNSLTQIITLLTPPPDEKSDDWLIDIFSIPQAVRRAKRRRRKVPPDPSPVPDLKPTPRPYNVTQSADGFRIAASALADPIPSIIRVRLAYDAEGNPFHDYTNFDFVVTDGSTQSLRLESNNVEFVRREGNVIAFRPLSSDFELRVRGFDPTRDLVVDVRAELPESEGDVANDSTNA